MSDVTINPIDLDHAEDCVLVGREQGECSPRDGAWNQPPRYAVDIAEGALGWVGPWPWCRVQVLAWSILSEQEDGVEQEEDGSYSVTLTLTLDADNPHHAAELAMQWRDAACSGPSVDVPFDWRLYGPWGS